MSLAVRRIMKDIMDIKRHPLVEHGIHCLHDDADLTKGTAMLIGPPDTPYQGGFYFFSFTFPPNYPNRPLQFKFHSFDESRQVRFHPNLYPDGPVCLSIINTWSGPSWSCVQDLSSVLLSIQSLLNHKPITNEPSHDKDQVNVEPYNLCIAHENLRISVIRCVRTIRDSLFSEYADLVERHFLDCYPQYVRVCCLHQRRDGSIITAPLYNFHVALQFRQLRADLRELYEQLCERHGVQPAPDPVLTEASPAARPPPIRIKVKPMAKAGGVPSAAPVKIKVMVKKVSAASAPAGEQK